MKYKGLNLENVKNNNRSAILNILNNLGAMSRKDIAEKTGLTPASVTLICTELLEEGVIYELGEMVEEKRAGRKKISVDINPTYKYILCICIESNETYITITDCKGHVIKSIVSETEKSMEPEDFLVKIAGDSTKLLWEVGISKDKLLGAAVSVPGKVDRKKGISLNTFSIWTKPVPIADILKKELSINVVVENNLKASAESELLFGYGKDHDDFVILKWGPGVGSAIIMRHRIYQGSGGLAGEIGHVSLGKGGKKCNCGKTGCLETELSVKAIKEDMTAAAGNKTKEKKIMKDKLDKLAFTMRNYVSLVDPSKVILIGPMFDDPEVYAGFVKAYKEYDETVPDCFFARSKVAFNASHTDPLATALNEWFFSK